MEPILLTHIRDTKRYSIYQHPDADERGSTPPITGMLYIRTDLFEDGDAPKEITISIEEN